MFQVTTYDKTTARIVSITANGYGVKHCRWIADKANRMEPTGSPLVHVVVPR